jgi:hypothetical protein
MKELQQRLRINRESKQERTELLDWDLGEDSSPWQSAVLTVATSSASQAMPVVLNAAPMPPHQPA